MVKRPQTNNVTFKCIRQQDKTFPAAIAFLAENDKEYFEVLTH